MNIEKSVGDPVVDHPVVGDRLAHRVSTYQIRYS
jgi:hypothetical protein